MARAMHPLCSCALWNSARVPFGRPSLSFSTSMRKWLMASDFSTKGLIVDSMRPVTVEGYVQCTTAGQARASSLATLINSVTSQFPRSSNTCTPVPL